MLVKAGILTPSGNKSNTKTNLMRTYAIGRCAILCQMLFSGALNSTTSAQETKDKNTLLFVGDVLTKTEYEITGGGRVIRWEKPPTLSVFGDQDRHPPVVAQTLRDINRAMPGHLQINQLPDEDESALIKLYFIKLESFAEIAKEHNFEVIANNRGFFFVQWNGKFEIISAIVLIAEDKLSGRALSHFVLEEVVQTMGLVGDSKRFSKSIFYESAPLSRFGTSTRLSPLDRKLIGFLYQHVPAGSVAIEVGQLFEKHW